MLAGALTHLGTEIGELDAEIARRAKDNEVARRLMTAPRIRPLIATAIAVLAPPPETVRKARDFAAAFHRGQAPSWGHDKDGRALIVRLLIIGANGIIIKRHFHAAARLGTWLGGMLTRKPPMLVRVTLENKMARSQPLT